MNKTTPNDLILAYNHTTAPELERGADAAELDELGYATVESLAGAVATADAAQGSRSVLRPSGETDHEMELVPSDVASDREDAKRMLADAQASSERRPAGIPVKPGPGASPYLDANTNTQLKYSRALNTRLKY